MLLRRLRGVSCLHRSLPPSPLVLIPTRPPTTTSAHSQHHDRICTTPSPATAPISVAERTAQPVQFDRAQAELPFYSHYPLDRRVELRANAAVLAEMLSIPGSKLIALHKDQVLVTTAPEPAVGTPESPAGARLAPVLLSPAGEVAKLFAAPGSSPIFLGVDTADEPVFAVLVGDPQAVIKAAAAAAAASAPAPARGATPGSDIAQAPANNHDSGGGGSHTDSAGSTSTAVSGVAGAVRRGPRWLNVRLAGTELAPPDAALLATASGLGQWHAAHGFDPATGSPTHAHAGGHMRKCAVYGTSLYPRIDPAVIMLVTATNPTRDSGSPLTHMAGDWCLLGRKAEWTRQRYSTLAGFLEVGEPLELAVAREVREESGVQVDLRSITYASSQPWPFPRSLMVGFYACAAAPKTSTPPVVGAMAPAGGVWSPPAGATGYDLLSHEGRRAAMDVGILPGMVDQVMLPALLPLNVDKEELEDCRWFHREWLRAKLLSPHGTFLPWSGDFNIPGSWSLAHRLIMGWLKHEDSAAGADTAWAGDVIPQVAIDEGMFKYVLLRLHDPATGHQKLLVWGDARAAWHMDVYQRVKAFASKHGCQVQPLGGGRMEHHSAQGVLSVYGYSGAFGPAPHELVAALLRKWMPFHDITISYKGY